jgi:hypothetical protein
MKYEVKIIAEEDERDRMMTLLSGDAYKYTIEAVLEYIRRELKYKEQPEEVGKILEKVRECIFDSASRYGARLD